MLNLSVENIRDHQKWEVLHDFTECVVNYNCYYQSAQKPITKIREEAGTDISGGNQINIIL